MISKVHIIGGPGSGKSYLANRLSVSLGVSSYDLDDLFWDNTAKSYGIRAEPETRDRKLHEILQCSGWIIEGVYHQWLDDSFRNAEAIVVLKPNVWLRDWRILKRFIVRKLGLSQGKRETFKGLVELLRWNHGYDSDNLTRARSVLEPYRDKMIECRRASEVEHTISKWSQQAPAGDVLRAAPEE